jgi:hypothetical protein
MERALADEKRSLAHWEDQKRPLTPGQIDVDPEEKPVGHSSKLLDQDSFELVKTLGTGAQIQPKGSNHNADTHARNLCARLARTLHQPCTRRPG